MKRPRKFRHMTSVGTEVEVKYEEVDADHVRILQYRRRRAGTTQFRTVPEEAGYVVRRDQLPLGDR